MFEDVAFEELPLLIERGVQAGLVNGIATVEIFNDGSWSVSDVFLQGWTDVAGRPSERHVKLDRDLHQWLYTAIWSQLTDGPFNSQITDAVADAIEGDGGSVPSLNADHRLTARELGVA